MSDRIVVMNNGGIEQIGTAEELYERPANRFVASFIGESNFLEGQVTHVAENAIQVRSDRGVEFEITHENRLGVGESVCVLLRPEKLSFLVGDEKPINWNTVEGTIEEEIYLGEIRRYKVKIFEDQVLSIKISSTTDVKHHERGTRVTVGWKWSDGIVVR
jgi:ABC-type Fe3+/spermidine/putrescine transport system ATPase subunit